MNTLLMEESVEMSNREKQGLTSTVAQGPVVVDNVGTGARRWYPFVSILSLTDGSVYSRIRNYHASPVESGT